MRVLHLMVYDGPGGYNRVIYDLCTVGASTPRVAAKTIGPWGRRMRKAGVEVVGLDRVMAPRSVDERVRRLDALLDGVDVANLHLGPAFLEPFRSIAALMPCPLVYTLHSPWRLPVTNSDIICLTRDVAALQARSNRCHVIGNGVDTTLYRPPPRRSKRAPIIIRTCRAERCAHYFWDAMMPVLQRHPDVELWIAGESGPSTDQVKYLGFRDDVPALLRRASIFVNAPRPGEGVFDLSILEAMSAGVVPIVTDVSCVGGAIHHNRDGVLVPYGDIAKLERAIERVVGETRRRVALGRAARTTIERHHDIRRTAAAYDRIYASMIGNAPGRRRSRSSAKQ